MPRACAGLPVSQAPQPAGTPPSATTLHQLEVDEPIELVTFGFALGQYRFGKYQSDPKPAKTEKLALSGASDIDDAAARGLALAGSVAMARDLINEPPVAKPPTALAETAQRIADNHGLDIRVYDEIEIEAEGFGGLRGVSLGADSPPRLVVLRYSPEGATRTVAFVGKGIVFDSGGLSIKTAAGMETMKTDMSGAAAVFGALRAVAELGLAVNVVGIAPLTENMSGGSAQRPGDVLRARNGKTIEVLNTDAEGRLVLADGLALAAEEEPDLIVDIATLTGAAAVALRPRRSQVCSPETTKSLRRSSRPRSAPASECGSYLSKRSTARTSTRMWQTCVIRRQSASEEPSPQLCSSPNS